MKRFLIILAVLVGIAGTVTVLANPLVAKILRSERHTILSDRISTGFKELRPSTYKWALWTEAVFIEVRIQKGPI